MKNLNRFSSEPVLPTPGAKIAWNGSQINWAVKSSLVIISALFTGSPWRSGYFIWTIMVIDPNISADFRFTRLRFGAGFILSHPSVACLCHNPSLATDSVGTSYEENAILINHSRNRPIFGSFSVWVGFWHSVVGFETHHHHYFCSFMTLLLADGLDSR